MLYHYPGEPTSNHPYPTLNLGGKFSQASEVEGVIQKWKATYPQEHAAYEREKYCKVATTSVSAQMEKKSQSRGVKTQMQDQCVVTGVNGPSRAKKAKLEEEVERNEAPAKFKISTPAKKAKLEDEVGRNDEPAKFKILNDLAELKVLLDETIHNDKQVLEKSATDDKFTPIQEPFKLVQKIQNQPHGYPRVMVKRLPLPKHFDITSTFLLSFPPGRPHTLRITKVATGLSPPSKSDGVESNPISTGSLQEDASPIGMGVSQAGDEPYKDDQGEDQTKTEDNVVSKPDIKPVTVIPPAHKEVPINSTDNKGAKSCANCQYNLAQINLVTGQMKAVKKQVRVVVESNKEYISYKLKADAQLVKAKSYVRKLEMENQMLKQSLHCLQLKQKTTINNVGTGQISNAADRKNTSILPCSGNKVANAIKPIPILLHQVNAVNQPAGVAINQHQTGLVRNQPAGVAMNQHQTGLMRNHQATHHQGALMGNQQHRVVVNQSTGAMQYPPNVVAHQHPQFANFVQQQIHVPQVAPVLGQTTNKPSPVLLQLQQQLAINSQPVLWQLSAAPSQSTATKPTISSVPYTLSMVPSAPKLTTVHPSSTMANQSQPNVVPLPLQLTNMVNQSMQSSSIVVSQATANPSSVKLSSGMGQLSHQMVVQSCPITQAHKLTNSQPTSLSSVAKPQQYPMGPPGMTTAQNNNSNANKPALTPNRPQQTQKLISHMPQQIAKRPVSQNKTKTFLQPREQQVLREAWNQRTTTNSKCTICAFLAREITRQKTVINNLDKQLDILDKINARVVNMFVPASDAFMALIGMEQIIS